MFWILQAYPNIEHAVINDINAELICTYCVIKLSLRYCYYRDKAYLLDFDPLSLG